MERILALLRANPEGLTSAELAQALGWSRVAVASTLKSMKRSALIQGAGIHRDGAAVLQLRTRPLQLNFFRNRQHVTTRSKREFIR